MDRDSDWRLMNEHLDRVIELTQVERAEYLAELQQSAPQLAARLAQLLRAGQQAAFAGFLEDPLLAEVQPSEEPLLGRMVGPYAIDAEIGRGGMGSVWRAHRADGRFEGTVAIKFVRALWQGKLGEQRFRAEGRLLGQLSHPNIARLLDAGMLDGIQPYLVIEYVQGVPIDVYCRRKHLDIRAVVEVFLSVLAAVAHANGQLIVHRDLKPANILVTDDGTVKLLDFGIAKLLGSAADEAALTKSSLLPVTPQYATPEQLLGQPITTATDVYALGLVLYMLFTGKHPVAGDSLSSAEFVQKVVTEQVPLASTVANVAGIAPRDLQGDLDNILAKALKKKAEERYASAAAFADDLRRYLNYEPVQARPDSLSYRMGRFVLRHRAAVAAGTAIAAALIAGVVGIYLQKLTADRERAEAQTEAYRAEESYRFLSSMVEEIGAGGGKLSPTQILDRGMYLLDNQTALDPRSRVDELRNMGTFYAALFESQKEREVLGRAEALARRISYVEGLIATECDEVDTELDQDRVDRARARLAEAQRLLAGLQHPSAMLQAEVEEEAASVAAASGDNNAAIAHDERALDILRAGGETRTTTYAAILGRLPVFYDALGQEQEAHRYTDLSGAAWDRILGSGSMESLVTLNNESVDLINFGEVRAALAASAEVLRRLKERGAGPAEQVPFRTNYGERLDEIGRHVEALSFLDQAIADARASDNLYWRQRAQLFRSCALVHAGKRAEAKAALDEIDAAYRLDAIKNAASLQLIAVCRSEWMLASGDVDVARTTIEGLLRSIDYPAQASLPVLRSALPVAARIALARHDFEAAQAYASAAAEYDRKRALDPDRSADRGRALMLLAQAQYAGGNAAVAVKTVQQALPALAGGLGPDHAEVTDARALLAAWAAAASGSSHPQPAT
ncbi:MAG TPA: serine/threonine-protein kinase [Steroidobacteraceae bacterium]|nr:serine/threonine-protein kinase [Steroidobacteraceae bacterium]